VNHPVKEDLKRCKYFSSDILTCNDTHFHALPHIQNPI
jgi:hypothetical protein